MNLGISVLAKDFASTPAATASEIAAQLQENFGDDAMAPQPVVTRSPPPGPLASKIRDTLRYLKTGVDRHYRVVYDITAIAAFVQTSVLVKAAKGSPRHR
jgi:hypothetical protein